MRPRLRLKTKLVLAITAMVAALVVSFSYVYVSQLVRTRMTEAGADANFVAFEVLNAAREAVDVDLTNTKIDLTDPKQVNAAIRDSLDTDPGLNSLLQSVVGYSRTIYDVAVTDVDSRVILDTNADQIGKVLSPRPDFDQVVHGGFRGQIEIVYGEPRVYEVRLPLQRAGAPFGTIRVGLSTILLKSELQPQLNRALVFSAIAIIVSLLLSAALSTFALRPLEAIGRRLDRLTAGEIDIASETERPRTDEYGVVTTKIDRLGRQIRDVKEVFSALKENLDQIMANLQDGLMLFTRDSRVVLVSASAEQFVGRGRAEMLGRTVYEVFVDGSPLSRMVLDSFTRHRSIAEVEAGNATGKRVQLSLDFIEQGGEQIGALLTMRDAESVRRIEDEIELSRRLAAIGRLTSGVAHEVKNPINAIVVHLEILRDKLAQTEPNTKRHIEVIGTEIHRLDRVVQTLVDFTRPVELRLEEVDLRKLIGEVVMLAEPEAAQHGVTVAEDNASEPLTVHIDSDLVKQAILNVVLNGVQAMPDGGTLNVALQRQDGTAVVQVHDQGAGIPPELRDKVFNLYFTTKQKGSGIGLAMTYRVMQLHNGSVDFKSQEGRGTTFYLSLPLAETRLDAAQEASARS